jgi:DNA-binding response OmpR family regulator
MGTLSFKALIVDDDSIARKTVRFALEQEQFTCVEAADGDQALQYMSESTFDLVVTDLCMPRMHGHSLAIEMLSHEPRPLVIVHSGLDDPRLTREMMLRGVDDFIYKPCNYAAFAAKARVLAERRQAATNETDIGKGLSHNHSQVPNALAAKANHSPRAIDVYFTSVTPETEIDRLIDFIQQDPHLSADVIRAANSTEVNKSGRTVSEFREAVSRLGFRRVADLALNRLKSAR